MDSFQGILVEYKLDAFNMPRTGTTLCQPKTGYVDLSIIPLSTHQLPFQLWSTLMEITPTLPNYQTRNSRWHPKFNSYNCNMSFVKMQKKKIPHTSNNTRCHSQLLITQFRLNKHNFSTSLAAPKANPIFHAANKKPIHKNTFRPSSSYFFIILPFISHQLARALQPPILANKLSHATKKPTSPAKIIIQKSSYKWNNIDHNSLKIVFKF